MISDINSPKFLECPKILVITPSLNHCTFLHETIESILARTYKNIAHIAVEGGSTDAPKPSI